MKTKGKIAILVATAGMSTAAIAQDASQAEVDALRARVEALESTRNGPSGDLSEFQLGNTQVDFYGYIKADFFYDFDFDQGDTAFVNVIGEPSAATDGTFGATARQSRIGLSTTTQTDIGQVGGQLELDLFGSNGTAELRLRHANIRIGDEWLIGQFWTNFMPLGQYPTSVEFNGPVGISFARVPQVRYSGSFAEGFDYSVSIEESVAQSDDPLFTAATQYSNDLFTARVAGLYGTATDGTTEVDQTAFTLSGSIQPWSGGLFQATFVSGEAIGPLLIGVGDAIVGGEANDVEGFTLEFRQDVTPKLNVGIAYGQEDYDLPTLADGATFDFTRLETIHVNAFYDLTDNLTLGAEYIFGERTTSAGQSFDGDRIQLSAQLNF